jgi:eukaryotic-like serine/threonine-protein kinase
MTEPPTLTIVERLGVGALAETFRARDADGADVVLKRMHRHCAYDPALVAMFEHEGRLLEALAHPSIPALRSRHRDAAGLPCMVLDYMPGRGLDAVMVAGPPPRALAVAWAAALLDALAHVHGRADEAGVALRAVHRDVTPGNVIVHDDGAAALIDFGIATSRWRVDPDRGVMKGSRGYMAPEVVTGVGVIDGRADVFGAGVVLYELLTGRRLYAGSAAEVMTAIVEAPVPSARDVDATVPEGLNALVQRCLAKRADARPTAAEARAALLRAG